MKTTTGMAQFILGEIAGYSEWGPEVSLRFVVRQVPIDPANNITQAKRVLQQRFTRHSYDTTGAVMGGEIEWRDVPTETE